MKDPAFLFYPGDYLRDTQCLSEKAQVAYDRIMCEHMRNISVSEKQLKFFTKRLDEDEMEELTMILDKDDNGYFIPWVVESIEKRRKYTQSRRDNRSKGDNENTHVYLMRNNKNGLIKIGSSVDPERRKIELQNENNATIEILAISEKGSQKIESELHIKYDQYRQFGEWFKITDHMIDHIINHMDIQFTNHMNTHMENEIENVNIDVIESKDEKENSGFEKFWIKYGRIGNKQKALSMYEKATKEVSPEYLYDKLDIYLKFLEVTNVFIKHASTWLNPKYKEFDNEYNAEAFNNKPKSPFDELREQNLKTNENT